MKSMTPVGYFLYDEQDCAWGESYAGTPNAIPLYTRPAELTDEEIDEVYAEYRAKGYKTLARAYLRKAQEK